jgi:hypothetical protein
MSYVIMNVGTEKLYKAPGKYGNNTYETERAAKGVATRLNKEYGHTKQWVAMSAQAFREAHPVKMVTRINLMSGLPFEEAEDTPNFCSPASEAYWSM